MIDNPEQYRLRPDEAKFLRDLTIREDAPGTILRDIETFMDYVVAERPYATGTGQLPIRVLSDLNVRMVHPIEFGLKRARQISYPNLHGLLLVARASGLVVIDPAGKKPHFVVNGPVRECWQRLNVTERYCVLLDAWLLRSDPAMVGDKRSRWGWRSFPLTDLAWFAGRITPEGLVLDGPDASGDELRYMVTWHNLGLSYLFGLIEIVPAPPKPGEGWQIRSLSLTPFGRSLLRLLISEFYRDTERVLDILNVY